MAESSSSPGLPELPHLGTFARAAELGSFTATAAELRVSQAAVSQRIALLEKELRASLFGHGSKTPVFG
jgi:DNA-binding transcriptional LysR family regulator